MNAQSPTSEFVDPRGQEGALPPPDPFDALTSSDLTLSAGKEATRLVLRIDAVPVRWRAGRWWAGAAIAVAVAVASGRLVDSRRSATVHRIQHPTKGLAPGRPRVESGPADRGRAKRVMSPSARRNHAAHPQPGVVGPKSHLVLGRRTRSDAGASAVAVSPATAAPPAEPEPPVEREPVARPQKPAGSQFSYLGE
jgi:hypothetical protein